MKSLTSIILLVALLFVSPDSPGRAETITSHFKVKGDTAIANFQTTDPQDPCIENFVSVVAADLMEKVSPGDGRTSTVRTVLVVGQRDDCLGVTLLSGQGETAQHAFQVADDLSSATLSATVPVLDTISFQFYAFEVNLTWTAQGKPVFEQTGDLSR